MQKISHANRIYALHCTKDHLTKHSFTFLDVAVEASKVSMQHEHITDPCEPKDIPPQGGLYRVAPRLADVPEFLGARFRRSKKWDTTLEVKNGTRHACRKCGRFHLHASKSLLQLARIPRENKRAHHPQRQSKGGRVGSQKLLTHAKYVMSLSLWADG